LLYARGECSTQRLRKFDFGKEALRIEVVLARLIDHADLFVPLGLDVRKDLVDLPFLKGNFVAFIAKAHRKTLSCCHSLVQIAFELEFLTTDTGSLVPV